MQLYIGLNMNLGLVTILERMDFVAIQSETGQPISAQQAGAFAFYPQEW